MKPVVAIVAPGAMGSAIGWRLSQHGLQVLTTVQGRSAETVERAHAAGMLAVDPPAMAQADLFLSVVPPAVAASVAQEFTAYFASYARKPLYVDCNAVNPDTAARIAAVIRDGGMAYVDGGIIGGPPKRGYEGPILYLSGKRADEAAVLSKFGLQCRVVHSGDFAASALKMSYAGITKGLTALASMMIIGACRGGVAADLRTELAQSQPMLLAWFERQVPSMFSKAHRWVAEMEEIAGFLQDPQAVAMFRVIAEFYAHVAGPTAECDVQELSGFFGSKHQSG
jgi:3-hydroxyisobutyrate dehydrogenase-like beta-hydroxyacid dehydrogenase